MPDNIPDEVSQTPQESSLPTPNPNPVPQESPNQPTQVQTDSSFPKDVKKGINQFNPMPQEQLFKPPPKYAAASATQLPTQPQTPQRIPKPKPKFLTPVKFTILILLLLLIGVITASAALVATDYTIFSPPAEIRTILENIFSANFF